MYRLLQRILFPRYVIFVYLIDFFTMFCWKSNTKYINFVSPVCITSFFPGKPNFRANRCPCNRRANCKLLTGMLHILYYYNLHMLTYYLLSSLWYRLLLLLPLPRYVILYLILVSTSALNIKYPCLTNTFFIRYYFSVFRKTQQRDQQKAQQQALQVLVLGKILHLHQGHVRSLRPQALKCASQQDLNL